MLIDLSDWPDWQAGRHGIRLNEAVGSLIPLASALSTDKNNRVCQALFRLFLPCVLTVIYKPPVHYQAIPFAFFVPHTASPWLP
jgi:hypothetical protein